MKKLTMVGGWCDVSAEAEAEYAVRGGQKGEGKRKRKKKGREGYKQERRPGVTGWINLGLAAASDSKLIFLTRKPPHKIRQKTCWKAALVLSTSKGRMGGSDWS
ncbi:hypothetical protein CLCR_11063 [Cladophialophora carrionii]|uniref:Uncharacterized protein n=1 Tax=Cladophialophora carrionii TaxID=86049 RepID=A0A1C1CYN0_9EURO|nr:hypothetical protein CLCR_11063 [Cladophialophora carrionii]